MSIHLQQFATTTSIAPVFFVASIIALLFKRIPVAIALFGLGVVTAVVMWKSLMISSAAKFYLGIGIIASVWLAGVIYSLIKNK
jgi:hypothetical protein